MQASIEGHRGRAPRARLLSFGSLRALGALAALPGLLAACSGGVSDEEGARIAYLGADGSIALALRLGFAGFNAASSANIPTQQGAGLESGTLTITGQVDQGASNNKGMRLDASYASYSDGPVEDIRVVYDSETPVAIDLDMKGLPDAALTGTMVGRVFLSEDLEGALDFALSFAGTTQADPNAPGEIRRVPGGTHVSGTATSDYGVYDVNLDI
ncbi:MAG: hypothetical protein IT373_12440 [Polyangiaceae bacterium]|nr:hypothetical protein [Polyangiaceae bacterium]